MNDKPTYLGLIHDVKGNTISVNLDSSTLSGMIFICGHGYKIGQVGTFVYIPLGLTSLFGVVSQVGVGAAPERLIDSMPHGNRWMTVQLVGEAQRNGSFSRGISQYPTIGDEVHIVTDQDYKKIYGYPNSPNFIKIGHLANAETIPALVNIDKLVTRHSAILGTTGSGKSTTVTGILLALSERTIYPSARIIVLDIHGEYSNALKDRANVFKIGPNIRNNEEPLYIPYWAMTFDELIEITFGNLDDNSRGQILEKVTALKLEALTNQPKNGVSHENLTVDTPTPFSIHRLWFDLNLLINATHTVQATGQSEETIAYLCNDVGEPIQPGDAMKVIPPKFKPQNLGAGDKIYLSGSNLNIRRQLEGLASKLRDPRFDFLFKPGPWMPDLDGTLVNDLDTWAEKWLGGIHPITILDLSGVPTLILNNVIGILLRIIYDALFWGRFLSEGGRERPLLVVLEEAHSYLSQDSDGPASQIVKRIVKEGRKYGIGAMIVSQRPAEIDSTVLSQCGTIFALRLSNSTDRSHVTSTVSDNLEGLLNMLPVLRTGEAIIVGEAVTMPIRTIIDKPPKNRTPDSSDPVIYSSFGQPGGWNRDRENSNYEELVLVWRRQNPRSPSIKTFEND